MLPFFVKSHPPRPVSAHFELHAGFCRTAVFIIWEGKRSEQKLNSMQFKEHKTERNLAPVFVGESQVYCKIFSEIYRSFSNILGTIRDDST